MSILDEMEAFLMAKILGSSAVSRMIEEGKIGPLLPGCVTYVDPADDLSGPIELDDCGVPVIPMDIDERRWLGGQS